MGRKLIQTQIRFNKKSKPTKRKAEHRKSQCKQDNRQDKPLKQAGEEHGSTIMFGKTSQRMNVPCVFIYLIVRK